MTNEQLIEHIREWEGAPTKYDPNTTGPFWATNVGDTFQRMVPGALETTCVATNDKWLDGKCQLVLTAEGIHAYTANRASLNHDYQFIARLPLTENRDDLIAAVRMVMALEINDRELAQT